MLAAFERAFFKLIIKSAGLFKALHFIEHPHLLKRRRAPQFIRGGKIRAQGPNLGERALVILPPPPCLNALKASAWVLLKAYPCELLKLFGEALAEVNREILWGAWRERVERVKGVGRALSLKLAERLGEERCFAVRVLRVAFEEL
jgi:ubiquinone biosynthesis protein UbiJ